MSYLALLAPAAGLVPSGLQATADRYTYLPGVVIAVAVVGGVLRLAPALRRDADSPAWAPSAIRMTLVMGALLMVVVASAVSARRALAPWADSIALWSRVVALDPRHDVGLYNLATALAAAGRPDEAAARYREVLALQPGHAWHAPTSIDSRPRGSKARPMISPRVANWRPRPSVTSRRLIVTRDAGIHMQGGAWPWPILAAARSPSWPCAGRSQLGERDPAIANTLGVLLLQSGQVREARVVFEAALALHQNDVNLAHNLARLLATAPDLTPGDAGLALRLANAVVEATAGRDPRAHGNAGGSAGGQRPARGSARNQRASCSAGFGARGS